MACGVCGKPGHNRRTCSEDMQKLPSTAQLCVPSKKKVISPVLLVLPSTQIINPPPQPAVSTKKQLSSKLAGVTDSGLRGVLPTADKIWQFRGDRDAYSFKSKDNVSSPERDHVFEIQLLDMVYDHYSLNLGQIITRDEKKRIMEFANGLHNTNVTSQTINRSKKGPFTQAKNELLAHDFDSTQCHGVDTFVFERDANNRRTIKYDGFTITEWRRIKREVVISFDYLTANIPNAIHKENNAAIFRDCLHETFMSLKID